MPARRGQPGQATVETVALLPLVVLVGALLWQVVVALLGGAAYAFYAVWRHYREYA